MYEEEDRGLEALHTALGLDITYVDTAQGYGNGKSETWVGKVIKDRRSEVLLTTKISVRDYDKAIRESELSLKRLQTDQVHLIHIHNLRGAEDLAAVEAGCLKVLMQLRDEGAYRFAGITSHTYPDTLAKALERHDFACIQMVLNAAKQGSLSPETGREPLPSDSFTTIALLVALRKEMGVLAMKVTSQDTIFRGKHGQCPMTSLLRYTLSPPFTTAVVGMPKLYFLHENVQIAQSFSPMPSEEMDNFSREIASTHKFAMYASYPSHRDV